LIHIRSTQRLNLLFQCILSPVDSDSSVVDPTDNSRFEWDDVMSAFIATPGAVSLRARGTLPQIPQCSDEKIFAKKKNGDPFGVRLDFMSVG